MIQFLMPIKYRDMTPEQKARHKELVLKWKRANPDKVKAYNWRTKRNKVGEYRHDGWEPGTVITAREFYEARLHQNGQCWICGTSPRRLFTNQESKTGKFRGLICRRCRKGLAAFGDSPAVLTKALKFIMKSNNHPSNSRLPVTPDYEEDPGP